MSKKQKKYIVTGGAGFVGSHLVTKLLNFGHKVVIIDNLYSGFKSFIPVHKDVEHINVDISDWSSLSRHFGSFKGADGVYHLSACARIQPSIKNPSLTHNYNVTGTINVLEMMRMCDIKNIVYSGSSSYYGNGASIPCKETDIGNPATPYAITKRMGEEYCQTWGKIYGIKSVILRYFNVYGRRSPLSGSYAPVIGLFFRQALLGEDSITVIGDGEQKRDFTHVGDVAYANTSAMAKLSGEDWKDVDGEIFNIGTGTNYSINEIAKMIQSALVSSGTNMAISHVPERLGESRETLADNNKAKELLGWNPLTDLEDGINDLKNYYLNNLDALRQGKRDL